MIDVALVSDPDLVEERLVEAAADLCTCRDVGRVAVPGEIEGAADGGFDVVEVGGCDVEQVLRVGDLVADAVLLALEEVEWDRVGVVGLDELGALVSEPADASSLSVSVTVGV